MNAFPPELLHHHFACMVVAGLTPPAKPASAPAAASSAPSASDASLSADPAAPSPPGPATATSASSHAPADHPTAAFPELTKALHDILASRARNTVWDPSRGRAAVFHTVFADHAVRLPPLKTKPSARHVPPIASITAGSSGSAPSESASAAFAALPPRSPLSPLHPNSPQFPDGLIAPVWVRKHRELVPSVFVSLHCLPLSTAPSPPTPEELRSADEELIRLISERRRSLAERGIKLTIVLLTHKHMLDDAQLEARLSFIRRSSGLDSRASLFVLTPVSRPELGEFVSSLHGALFEPAADYYREHARRVKRKRTRYPPPPSVLQPIVTALGTLAPAAGAGAKAVSMGDVAWLSREGWIVRSEYKLGVFAELAGDMHEAGLRYREAYDLLCCSPTCLLGSTLMLPPRTKRWAEAKVLADTLCVRICKLALYADDAEGAAAYFRRHLARFTDLSTGWGIGAMTFEYWSWLGKQYRMFGELVEHATRQVAGAPLPAFQLPAHAPPLPSRLLHPDALPAFADGRGGVNPPPGMLLPNQNAVAVAVTPYATLQGAGAYFYLAALCTLERRARFVRAVASAGGAEEEETSPLAHERKVDHTAQITETLTKAYDAFKRARQHRAALLVAARIATTYHDGAQHTMALKFLERILRSYTKDDVHDVRAALVEIAADAAVAAGDSTAALKMLIEMLDPRLPIEHERKKAEVQALKTLVLQSNDAQDPVGDGGDDEPEGRGNVAVAPGMWSVEAVLPVAEVDVGTSMAFQVVVRNVAAFDVAEVVGVDSIAVHVRSGDDARETVIRATSSGGSAHAGEPIVVDVGAIDASVDAHAAQAPLNAALTPGGTIVLQGTIKPDASGPVRIDRIILCAHTLTTSRRVHLEAELALEEVGKVGGGLCEGRWMLPSGRSVVVTQRADPRVAHVRPQRFDVSLGVTSTEVGYVDERIAVRIAVGNNERTPLVAWIDATLQPSYDGAHDTLWCDMPHASATQQSVKAIEVGSVPAGESREVVLWLTPAQAAGVRTVDVALRVARQPVEGEVDAIEVAASASGVVPVVALFDAKTWTRGAKRGQKKGLLEWETEVEAAEERLVGLDIEVVGGAVEVVAVELDGQAQPSDALGEWTAGDRFSFALASTAAAEWRVQWRRSDTLNTTLFPVVPAADEDLKTGITVTLVYAQRQRVHRAFDVDLVVDNHHATRSYALALSLDTDANFTAAATRHLTLPHILPHQTVTVHLARLVPQAIGRLSLPNLAIAILDPANLQATLASRNTNSHQTAIDEPRDAINLAYFTDKTSSTRVDQMPRIVVTL
ncbi:glutathione transferase omega-1 [Moesziomyces antarcticus]|uniref:Glutathione transferase omega-1 n=2 Tax=Pseudozyma antarctica TaxID=84753 RepID=A0A081CID9_PSEA2|nr:glutathione transferase omega-1 [Moesziomyces antarcticus]GAK66435.1 glutathione transferase omega-1 [Moesziomyces antarcticus]SPO47474.1 uncharacterized protein PSANT_05162 [Moesziomyces antarcticus]